LSHPSEEIEVIGAICLAVGQACVNLQFYTDEQAREMLADLRPDVFYPISMYLDLLRVVTTRYLDPAPILEQIGSEFSRIWYAAGGNQIVRRGVEFLHFQADSTGYRSVMRGPAEQLGEFTLVELDEAAGTAMMRSTTPYPKDFERGVVLGGLLAPGDLVYVDVDNTADANTFQIEFH
jgi:hypothetical protein